MAKMSLREYANQWLKKKGIGNTEAKKQGKKYKSIAAAKKAGALYYTDKNGKLQLAVYAEDLKKAPTSKRDSSPKPKLRPTSTKDKPKKDPSRLAAEAKKADTGDKAAVAKGGKTVAEITKMARSAINSAGVSPEKKDRIKKLMKEMQDARPSDKSVPGRALYLAVKNTVTGEGPTNPTAIMRKKKEDKKITRDSSNRPDKYKSGFSKGGMAKKSGYRSGGVVKANCGASVSPNRMNKK